MIESNFKARRILQAQRVRGELEEFLYAFEFEVVAESTPRHLKNVGTVCALLLEKLIRITGATIETNGYADKIHCLAARGAALWTVEEGPGIVKAKARLSLIPGGVP